MGAIGYLHASVSSGWPEDLKGKAVRICRSPLYCDGERFVKNHWRFAEKGTKRTEPKPGDLPVKMSVVPVGD